MLQAETLLQQSSLLKSPHPFRKGKKKSSTSKAPLSTPAPCRALPLLWASRQPCQDLESCWHSSTMATAAAVLGKAFPCRWRQDRHNEKPGPLSTNKIIQDLSTSPKPEALGQSLSVLMGVPSKPIWGCFPRSSCQRQPRTVCVA